jgi:hypothetical protein
MQGLLLVAVLMQVRVDAPARDSTDSSKVKASLGVTADSKGSNRGKEPRRIPLTPEHLRTAFKSAAARTMLERARSSRLRQDSALMSYEATAYLRISAGMGFSRIGRDRLIFRHENVTHVKWHRDVGAWVDVTGARTALPAGGEVDDDPGEFDGDMGPLPYYPGQEQLLSFDGSEVVKSQVDERDMVHPLAEGAEAYYTYEAGDSVTFRLPDGRTIELRELSVRPRKPRWNVAVGSLWFDARTGQLVRAAYRLSVPMDIWAVVEEEEPDAKKEIPVWVMPIISPMRAQISAIAVEYGLYQGRFWLPRLRSAEGDAQVSFMRVPFKFENSIKYQSVNALDSLPPITVVAQPQPPDSLSAAEREKWRDSVREARREARRAQRDSVKAGLRPPPIQSQCDTGSFRVTMTKPVQGSELRVATRVPCDMSKLANSPELPKSIYDEGEEIWGSAESDALLKEALRMGAQPPFSIRAVPPTIRYGLEFTRFNRIEGLSSGVLVEQVLGAGYTASVIGRLGHADLEPNGELTLSRTNLTRTLRARAYNRLVAANDWGNPLSFGSSLSALLFGRDEGFYYRASGAELEWTTERGTRLDWRAFAERQRTAAVENEFSLGPRFLPNIQARTAQYAGLATRFLHSHGLDPNGFRAFTDLRLEGAVSDSASAAYGRGALDLTLTEGFGRYAAAITASAGASAGELPSQRHWYLGGAYTVRGQRPDTAMHGNAYWLGRVEVGTNFTAARPIVFGDIGWVGERTAWRDVARPMSGAGVGVSFLDGLIRFDVSRGIYPQKRIRVDMYVDAKF